MFKIEIKGFLSVIKPCSVSFKGINKLAFKITVFNKDLEGPMLEFFVTLNHATSQENYSKTLEEEITRFLTALGWI